jgi:hypothetical protein
MKIEAISKTEYEPDEVDELERTRERALRYLVSWLPWFSLLGYFYDKPVMEMRKDKKVE